MTKISNFMLIGDISLVKTPVILGIICSDVMTFIVVKKKNENKYRKKKDFTVLAKLIVNITCLPTTLNLPRQFIYLHSTITGKHLIRY